MKKNKPGEIKDITFEAKDPAFKSGTITIKFDLEERKTLDIVCKSMGRNASGFIKYVLQEWYSLNKGLVEKMIKQRKEFQKIIEDSNNE